MHESLRQEVSPHRPLAPSSLQRWLERRLSRHFGQPRAIAGLARRPSPYASSFAIEEIDVTFADGASLPLVMKDLSADAMDAAVRLARPAFLYDPARELHAYRRILPFAPSGTAVCFGAVATTTGVAPQYRLFLERVDGFELRHVGALSIWEQTARWIARFHRSLPPRRLPDLAQAAGVVVYDSAFYALWFERARQFAAMRSAATEQRTLDRLAPIHARVVERLASLPRTVIHGELYPCNVLIDESGPEVRVCPVDWEMIALGPGVMDLAALTTGWKPHERRALARAYRAAADEQDAGAAATLARRSPREFLIDLDCCCLHLAVRMLGWSDAWTPPPQHAHDWLREAAALADRLASRL